MLVFYVFFRQKKCEQAKSISPIPHEKNNKSFLERYIKENKKTRSQVKGKKMLMKPSRFSFNQNVISFVMMTHSHKFLVIRFDDKQQQSFNTHSTHFQILVSFIKASFFFYVYFGLHFCVKLKSCNKHKSVITANFLPCSEVEENNIENTLNGLRVYRQEAHL